MTRSAARRVLLAGAILLLGNLARAGEPSMWDPVVQEHVYRMCLKATKGDTTTCTCALARLTLKYPDEVGRLILEGSPPAAEKFSEQIIACSK